MIGLGSDKNYQEDDDNHIMGSVIRPWWQSPLESHWMQTKGSPCCAASLKFHARVYSHNYERSPTLQVESLLFVPRSLAKTLGKSVLADSRLGGLAKTEVLVFD